MFRYYEKDPQALARVFTERSRRLFCAWNFAEFGECSSSESKTAEVQEANLIASLVKSDLTACKTHEELKQVVCFWIAVIRHRFAMNDESSSVVTSFCAWSNILCVDDLPELLEIESEIRGIKNLFPAYWDNSDYVRYCNSIIADNFSRQTKILNILPFLTHLLFVKERTKVANNDNSQAKMAEYLDKMGCSFRQLQERLRALDPFATQQALANFESLLAKQKKLSQYSRMMIGIYKIQSIESVDDMVLEDTNIKEPIPNNLIKQCGLRDAADHFTILYIFDFSSLNSILLIRDRITHFKSQFEKLNKKTNREIPEKDSKIKNFQVNVQIKIKAELLKDVVKQIEGLQAEFFDIWDPKLKIDFSLLVTDEHSNVLRIFLDTSPHTEKFARIASTVGIMGFLRNRECGMPPYQREFNSLSNASLVSSAAVELSMENLSLK